MSTQDQCARPNPKDLRSCNKGPYTYLAKCCRAAALGTSGRIFFGCNMEFPGASLASSVHAEQCLTANLLRHKESEIITVAISAPPCGHCRQFFSEMACVVSYWIDMIARPDLLQRVIIQSDPMIDLQSCP